jgi:hypothetical protein
MNAATAAATSIRIAALVAVLAAAAILGLAFGSALDARTDESRTIAGYPPGWQGGAAIPVAQSATFSLEALDAVRVTRGDEAPAARDSFSTQDYADLHDSEPTDAAPKGIPPHVE